MAFLQTHAPKANGAIVFLDDAFTDPKPNARTLGFFGGEKWLKNLSGVLCTNTHTGIVDGDASPLGSRPPVLGEEQLNSQASALRHGLYRVSNNVQEYLLELAGEALNRAGSPVSPVHRDVVQLEPPRLQLNNIVEDSRQRQSNGLIGFTVKAERLL